MAQAMTPDARLDLVFTRTVPVPRRLIWRAWTEPAHLLRWFTPAPWQTVQAEVDLRPGGIFRTLMRGPEGQEHDHVGCWLVVEEPSRLVWTDALGPGFRPAATPFVTASLTLEEVPGGTRYTAHVMHKDEADRERHAAMGFEEGWGKALDQLVALTREMSA